MRARAEHTDGKLTAATPRPDLPTVLRSVSERLRGYPLATVRTTDGGGVEVLAVHRKLRPARRFVTNLRLWPSAETEGAYLARVVE